MADKLHTQAELNALLAEQKRQHRTKLTELEQQLAAAQARVAELEPRLAELEPVAAKYDELRGNVRRERVERELAAAFTKHRAVTVSIGAAGREFVRAAQVEHGEDGAVVGVEYNGQRYANLDEAGKAFLAANPWFQQPPIGGSGSPLRNIGAPPVKAPELDPLELLRVGLAEPVKPLVAEGPRVLRG